VDCLAIREQYDSQMPVFRFRHQRPASNTTVSEPDEALADPARIVALVMNVGDYADVQALVAQAGDDVSKRADSRGCGSV